MATILTIESDSRPGHKSRSFRATLLGHLVAPALWGGGSTDTKATRPVWAVIAASAGAAGPFLMNAKMGKKAHTDRECYEWLRSAGYVHALQKTDAGVLATIYLPDLFRQDPGMVDPQGVTFVALPSAAFLAEQARRIDVEAAVQHVAAITTPSTFGISPDRWNAPVGEKEYAKQRDLLRDLAPLAPLFALYLDRRTRCPILPDTRFQLQVFVRFLKDKRASLRAEGSYNDSFGQVRSMLRGDLPEELGYGTPVACRASHEDVEQILADETEAFFAAVNGKPRRRAAVADEDEGPAFAVNG